MLNAEREVLKLSGVQMEHIHQKNVILYNLETMHTIFVCSKCRFHKVGDQEPYKCEKPKLVMVHGFASASALYY